MKPGTQLLLALAILFGVAACSSDTGPLPPPPIPPAPLEPLPPIAAAPPAPTPLPVRHYVRRRHHYIRHRVHRPPRCPCAGAAAAAPYAAPPVPAPYPAAPGTPAAPR